MKRMLLRGLSVCFLVTLSALAPRTTLAQVTYTANAGAETEDQSVQADAFFPNELWILEGDTIKWTFVPKNEIHTVTFLEPAEARPMAPPPAGPPFPLQVPKTDCKTFTTGRL